MDLREANNVTARRHPWEVSRFDFFAEVLRQHGACASAVQVLDVGSGDAWFAQQLGAQLPVGSHITCWDTGYEEAASAHYIITRTPAKPNLRADVILLLDVLEHVEHDAEFLSALVRDNAHSGSRVLISVPAWPALFTRHDEYLKHFRRYSPAAAISLITAAGLSITQSGGLFHSLLAARIASKVRELASTPDAHASGAHWNHGPLVTGAIGVALAADNRASFLFSRLGLSVPGLSWWALCTIR